MKRKRKQTTWSKLKKTIENLFVPGLMLELKSTVYRCLPNSHYPGSGRFWIVLDGEIIWDITREYPKESTGWKKSPYTPFNQVAMGLLHRYNDTPVADLEDLRIPDKVEDCPLCKNFEQEYGKWKGVAKEWEIRYHYRDHFIVNALLSILLMADRRIGKKRKKEILARFPDAPDAAKYILKRLTGAPGPFHDKKAAQAAYCAAANAGSPILGPV